MATYRYKANKQQGKALILLGTILAVVGVGLMLSNLVLAFGFGDTASTLGPIGSKIVFFAFVVLGLVLLGGGYRSMRTRDQEILVTDDAVTVPTGELSNELVTLRRGDITSLKIYSYQGNRSLGIKYNGGKTKLMDLRFESCDAFEAMIAGVSAVAGMPAVPSRL